MGPRVGLDEESVIHDVDAVWVADADGGDAQLHADADDVEEEHIEQELGHNADESSVRVYQQGQD